MPMWLPAPPAQRKVGGAHVAKGGEAGEQGKAEGTDCEALKLYATLAP